MLTMEGIKGIISCKLYNARIDAAQVLLHLGEKRNREEPDEELDEEYEDEEEYDDEEDEEAGDMIKKIRKRAMKIIKEGDSEDKESEY